MIEENVVKDINGHFFYHQTGHSYPAQARTNVVPHPDAPTPDLLTHRQLQEEERDANDEEEDEVGDEISS